MGSSRIEIANNALGELGEEELASLSEISPKAEAVETFYESTIKDLLGKADWRFAIRKEVFARDVQVPLNEWSYQFTPPAGFIRLLRFYQQGSFEIYAGPAGTGLKIYSNAQALTGDCVMRVDESFFSDPFTRLASLELAVRMCMKITGDVDLKTRLQGDTRLQFGAALASDAQQRPNQRFMDAPFINCRF